MSDVPDQPLFHLTPREVYDLFLAGVGECNNRWREGLIGLLPKRPFKEALIDLLYTHTMHKRHEAGNPIHDRDELRRSIEAMFEGVK